MALHCMHGPLNQAVTLNVCETDVLFLLCTCIQGPMGQSVNTVRTTPRKPAAGVIAVCVG